MPSWVKSGPQRWDEGYKVSLVDGWRLAKSTCPPLCYVVLGNKDASLQAREGSSQMRASQPTSGENQKVPPASAASQILQVFSMPRYHTLGNLVTKLWGANNNEKLCTLFRFMTTLGESTVWVPSGRQDSCPTGKLSLSLFWGQQQSPCWRLHQGPRVWQLRGPGQRDPVTRSRPFPTAQPSLVPAPFQSLVF